MHNIGNDEGSVVSYFVHIGIVYVLMHWGGRQPTTQGRYVHGLNRSRHILLVLTALGAGTAVSVALLVWQGGQEEVMYFESNNHRIMNALTRCRCQRPIPHTQLDSAWHGHITVFSRPAIHINRFKLSHAWPYEILA